jgi:nucleoid DNA-binding protein
MLDSFDSFYEKMKSELINEVSSKTEIKCSQRRSLLDTFFSRLDSETDKI